MGLRNPVIDGKALLRIGVLTAVLAGIGGLVLWDRARVEGDFTRLKDLLRETRYRAISKDKTLVVRFSGNAVTVLEGKTHMPVRVLVVPTLDQVNYDTVLGNDTIVFDGHGTSARNKREHGGDLRLKSWLGFRKNIAVNCTGLVTEGVYPNN